MNSTLGSVVPLAMFLATMLDHAPLEAVHIYFDTATYDEIERDQKVTKEIFCWHLQILELFEGDNGSSIGFDWRYNGPSHWLLHPQWGRDCLLPH